MKTRDTHSKLILALALLLLLQQVTLAQTDLRIGLVAYWDEHTPNDNDLSYGNYSDVDDSLTNTGTSTADGIIGDGRQFNGSDSARMTASHSADFGTLTTDATICWWQYVTKASDLQTIMSKGTGDTGGFEIPWTNSRAECGAGTCMCMLYPNVAYECTQTLSTSLNTWEFWCIVKDTDGLVFWKDAVNETEQAQGQDFNTADALLLGVQAAPSTRPYNGILDEIGIWNITLNKTQIELLYNSGSGCNPVTSPTGCAAAATTQTPTVTNLINITQTTTSISLNWSGNGVEYAIYQDGSFIANTSSQNYTVASLINGTSYVYNLTAYNSTYDIAASNFSNTISVTTLQTTQAITNDQNQTDALNNILQTAQDIEEVLNMIPLVTLYAIVLVTSFYLLRNGENFLSGLGLISSIGLFTFIVGKLIDVYWADMIVRGTAGDLMAIGSLLFVFIWLAFKTFVAGIAFLKTMKV